ncbi:MAG: metallophosphoesterase [Clostridiales bacterium]|nr:metallophosphoesterase [Clostridiales bacterium]
MGRSKDPDKKSRPRKKHPILKAILLIPLVIIVALGGIVGYNIILNQNFTVTFYQIRSDKVSNNVRIVELADLHSKEYGKNNQKLINRIKDLKPDIIVYAGDMMMYRVDDYSVLFDLSDKLSEIAPIYACFGNHELDQYLFRDKNFKQDFISHNVNLLANEAVEVEVKDSVVQIIGLTDDYGHFDSPTNNSKKFMDSLEPTDNCRLCLTHYPELFFDKLLNRGIDVAFTGHIHGGLIRIPRIGGLYSPTEGFFPTLTAGVYEPGDGSRVVISRGLGDSSKIPRINNQPELVVVDICWY